jgi:cytochrome c-type biogenesis protein CcmH/NrfF
MRRSLLVLLALACVTPAAAFAATPKTSLIDVEDEVMCISCNVALNIAESPQAYAQKQEIQRLIDQGLTKDQVKDRLVEQYGKRVLALPEGDGFELTVYLVPIAVVVALLGTLAVLVPRWRRRGPDERDGDDADRPALDAHDAARLDAELAAFDR